MIGAPLRATVTNNDQTLIEKDECAIIMLNMLSSCAFSHLRSQIKKLVVAFAWWIVVKEVKKFFAFVVAALAVTPKEFH